MDEEQIERIEQALLDIALCVEAGQKYYKEEHPEGIYQKVVNTLYKIDPTWKK